MESFSVISGVYSKESFYEANGFYRQLINKMKLSEKKRLSTEEDVVKMVKDFRLNDKGTGSRPMYAMLKVNTIGINKFEKIMSKYNLGVKIKKKHIVTTNGVYEEHDVNLINGLELTGINQVIAGDITYLITRNKTYYIFTLKDMYSKRILSLKAFENMYAINALKLLKEASKLRGKDIFGCIHHTDAGSQYKANIYKKTLNKLKMKQSIAENCLQNGMAEQLNGQVKNRFLTDDIKNVKHLNKELLRVKTLLNEQIPKKALGYKTPVAFEKQLESLPIEKRMKIKLYDFNQKVTSLGNMGTLGKA